MATITMTHPVAGREEWLKERLELLGGREGADPKKRRGQEAANGVARVEIEKDYRFPDLSGEKSLRTYSAAARS